MRDPIQHLPLQDIGLNHIPAVPYLLTFSEPLGTVLRLGLRSLETRPAKDGLSIPYTIGNRTATAFEFLYGSAPSNPLQGAGGEIERILAGGLCSLIQRMKTGRTVGVIPASGELEIPSLPLEQPEQFAISWTTFANVYQNALPQVSTWASSLTSPSAAAEQFWPTIANFGLAYNLIVLKHVTAGQAAELKPLFGNVWSDAGIDAIQETGRLYAIDMSIFESFSPATVDNLIRFTPGTVTLLEQNAATKKLTPLAVRVSAQGNSVVYSARSSTPGAWLYALQAAKASVTVYGIWLGHVYHWHIVTAAMQMTMYNNLPAGHPIYQLLQPQSNYLIPFNEVLLILWSLIAPPTSFDNPLKFLQLADVYATGREFFDDDPLVAIGMQGLDPAQFTQQSDWDLYPVVKDLLKLWEATGDYVGVFVDTTYATDADVAGDTALQSWMSAASDPQEGNVRGLPAMLRKSDLKNVLTSLMYRVTAHGISRLNNSANPVLTFSANYPPCLQSATLPSPGANLDTQALLKLLPWTGTIGELVNFYFIFVFSAPYEPFIPVGGVETNLPFSNGMQDPRNRAIVDYRNRLIEFINDYEPSNPQIGQWPLNIET
jgi:hypothetical protein